MSLIGSASGAGTRTLPKFGGELSASAYFKGSPLQIVAAFDEDSILSDVPEPEPTSRVLELWRRRRAEGVAEVVALRARVMQVQVGSWGDAIEPLVAWYSGLLDTCGRALLGLMHPPEYKKYLTGKALQIVEGMRSCRLPIETTLGECLEPILAVKVAHWHSEMHQIALRQARARSEEASGEDSRVKQAAERRRQLILPLLKRRKKMSVVAWSELAGVPKSSVYDYLNGKSTPTTVNARALADALGIDELPD